MTYVFKNTDSRIFNQMNLVFYFLIKTLLQNAQIKMNKFLAGKCRVAYFWSKILTGRIKKLSGGNEWIIAIEVLGQVKFCLIKVYTPKNNSSVNSHLEYRENPDTYNRLFSKLRQLDVSILCDDSNGILLDARPYNKLDYLLQTFVNGNWLKCNLESEHIFYHHAGMSIFPRRHRRWNSLIWDELSSKLTDR